MATEVIHDHGSTRSDSSGLAVGIILFALLVLFLLYIFGNGALRGIGGGGPNVQVPGKIDVNLNQGAR